MQYFGLGALGLAVGLFAGLSGPSNAPEFVMDTPNTSNHAGAESLLFIAKPRKEQALLMPDWPVLLPVLDMDAIPQLGFQPPNPIKTRIQSPDIIVVGHRLSLRKGPSTQYAVITQLVKGQKAYSIGPPKGGWVPIKVASSGQKGWVFHRYISKS